MKLLKKKLYAGKKALATDTPVNSRMPDK